MTSSTPIPDEAVEAAWLGVLKGLVPIYEQDVEQALEAAYPHLLAAWTQRLLSDEAVEAALYSHLDKHVNPAEGEELNVIRQDVREALQAALASIDSEEEK